MKTSQNQQQNSIELKNKPNIAGEISIGVGSGIIDGAIIYLLATHKHPILAAVWSGAGVAIRYILSNIKTSNSKEFE